MGTDTNNKKINVNGTYTSTIWQQTSYHLPIIIQKSLMKNREWKKPNKKWRMKKSQANEPLALQQEKDKTERATGLGTRMRWKIGKGNHMKAL